MMTTGFATQLDFADQRRRWGDAVDPGLLIVPNALLKHQHQLQLETLDVVLILHIIDFWDEEENLPYPRFSTLAKRVDRTTRTVERAVAKLASYGYIKHLPSELHCGRTIRRFDLSGLITKLQELSRQAPLLARRRQQRC